VNETLDLKKPEAVAQLRHRLRTPLNLIIGHAEMVRRQAAEQTAAPEAALMEQVLSAARRIEDMVQEALPPERHAGEGSLARLRVAMQGYIGRISSALERFEELAASACSAEIGKIRAATRELFEFAGKGDALPGVPALPSPEAGEIAYPTPRAEDAERAELAQRLELLLECTGEGIFGLGRDGVCAFINRAALEMLGYHREALLGRNLYEIVHQSRKHGPPHAPADCPILAALAAAEPRRGCDWFVRADGSSFPIEYSSHPILHDGRPDGAIITFTDISERDRGEERLVQTAKLESLGLLAGGIAHDFNNILTGILGNASLVLESLPPEDRNRSLLAEVVKSSERAADLTRQMLAFAGKGQFVLEAVDVSQAVQSIAELLGASIPKSARLELRLAPNLPKFQADLHQIQQLALNLVINAGEATEEREGRIAVETGVLNFAEAVSAEAAFGAIPCGRYVYLSVADNGVGMDEATRARIFDPFFTTKFTGRGLGLAAAMGIVRAHQGAIRVESRSGEGSRFEVLFPVAAEAGPEPPPLAATAIGAGQTILLVDDEDIVRRTARAMLERKGYQVLLAENGREAVDLFREQAGRIALVLLDLTMPVMSGDQAIRHLHAIRHDVPILVSSGYPEDEVARRFSGARVRGYVRKPYTSATLIEKIQAALT
jgi:PAS domain S-box-containing protein